MMFNKDFVFIEDEKVSDGMGGYDLTEIQGTAFKAHSTPVKAETILKEQGFLTTKGLRLITKDVINPNESLKLKNVKTNEKYRVIESLGFASTPYIIFLLEVI
ncbi:hypothetical protein FQ085_06505 [Planococcus sp. ANT_H30]|uniref:hypothetical protein n=1 Tax=Planococcus sp. ANT_H30 TaxID=2597347 RepID=UPI0011EE8FCD|nr:hypothetical protein [Planococcus sp. ANT_H30]KAA0957697.1 hypothetical protein FQ085_06505 [Planococcus sp. ANT_H30]